MESRSNRDECFLQTYCHRINDGRKTLKVALFLSKENQLPDGNSYRSFSMEKYLQYDSLCDDFGPINVLWTARFIEALDEEIRRAVSDGIQSLVFCCLPGARNLSNSVFLIGAYLLLKLDHKAATVGHCFQGIDTAVLEGFRDASTGEADFRLSLIDCWRGLERAKEKNWFKFPNGRMKYMWGQIDIEAYEHYDNPLHADLHEVCPGEVIVFRGPKNLEGSMFRDKMKNGEFVHREFSPEYSASLLQGLGVTTVIRVGSPCYSAAEFTQRGFQHFDIDFDGRSTPPSSEVTRFFRIVDAASGRVAIHGRESLSRSGLLCGLYLMRRHGFRAREAIAWLRLVRPGSVLGDQQHYLVRVETAFRSLLRAAGAAGLSMVPQSPQLGAASDLSPFLSVPSTPDFFARCLSAAAPPPGPLTASGAASSALSRCSSGHSTSSWDTLDDHGEAGGNSPLSYAPSSPGLGLARSPVPRRKVSASTAQLAARAPLLA